MNQNQSNKKIQNRVDLQRVADMINPGSRVLDIGCGDGALLDYLVHYKQVDGRGIELSQEGVNRSVSLGLAVVQGDAEADLKNYPSDAFDYVILSQTLQSI
jgi:methionine biosynthesis protein MetW